MKKGDVWLVEIPSIKGREQEGHRPAVIIADVRPGLSIIIPCTSNHQALRFQNTLLIRPSPQNGLERESIALIMQIRAIDKKRLKKRIGHLEKSIIHKINSLLKTLLSIE